MVRLRGLVIVSTYGLMFSSAALSLALVLFLVLALVWTLILVPNLYLLVGCVLVFIDR